MIEKPHYEIWDSVDFFKLYDAAALCCDIEPQEWTQESPAPRRVRAMADKIYEAFPQRLRMTLDTFNADDLFKQVLPEKKAQFFMKTVPGAPPDTPNLRYMRDELRKWSETTGQRQQMPFLFPEDRDQPLEDDHTMSADPKNREKQKNNGVSEREEPSVLKILAALLQEIYGDDIVADLTALKSTRFGEVYADVRKRFEISEDTVRNYFKRLPVPPKNGPSQG